MTAKHVVYHIPVCPFSQRLEILLALRGPGGGRRVSGRGYHEAARPRASREDRGTTALPVLETRDGRIIKESLVILRYLDEVIEGPALRRSDPAEHAIESMLIAREGPFTMAGYLFVMNQERERRDACAEKLLPIYRDINDFLLEHAPGGPYLFDGFGLAETVFTPMFKRFWFLDYYEDFRVPEAPEYRRVLAWRDACMSHQATQQVTKEEIVKLYYDYALGTGNGALVEGRSVSSFAFTPHWKERPWPPRDKYAGTATDEALGLVA